MTAKPGKTQPKRYLKYHVDIKQKLTEFLHFVSLFLSIYAIRQLWRVPFELRRLTAKLAAK